ncbi:MAG: PA14 domain-containing protein [Planctomycetota bacterium]
MTGELTFYGKADNGMRLEVDGKVIVDNWDEDEAGQLEGKMNMVKGKKYPIVLSYSVLELGGKGQGDCPCPGGQLYRD